MSLKSQQLLNQAMELSESERLEVAYALLESVNDIDPNVESAWTEEMLRRAEAVESGRRDTRDWNEFRDQLLSQK